MSMTENKGICTDKKGDVSSKKRMMSVINQGKEKYMIPQREGGYDGL